MDERDVIVWLKGLEPPERMRILRAAIEVPEHILKKLFSPAVHVKPVDNGFYSDTWLIVRQTPLQAFVDDRRRYGWRVAWANLRVTLTKSANNRPPDEWYK